MMRRYAAVAIVIGMATVLGACSKTPEEAAKGGAASTPAPVDPETAKILATLPAPYNTADLENGPRTITEGGANMTGPNLHGVFGRKAGTHEKFRYSQAVQNAGFVWDAEHLDKWLQDPRGFLPGNRMSFMGVKDEKDRIDLIAYLKVESGYQPGG